MKKHALRWSVLLPLPLLLLVAGCPAEKQPSLETRDAKVSYGIGLNIGRDIHDQKLELDEPALIQGLKDGLAGREPLVGEEELTKAREEFITERQAKIAEERQALAEKNKQEGEAFLTENAKKEGVVTTPSGLQYQVIEPGSGKSPTAENKVKVHYRGMLLDGTVFDSSYERDQPAVLPVTGVIPGWTEVLPLMKEGAKWKVFIPAELAYGTRGAGNLIGPNQVLIFEIELIGIQ